MNMKSGVEQAVYALLVLTRLPRQAMLSGEALSQQLHVSPTYLQKLMRRLVQAGIVLSVPGAKGGFRLQASPEDITIYDVFMAIEGVKSLYRSTGILEGMLQLNENSTCLLSDVMDEAEDAWQTVLKRQTIASLHRELNANCSTDDLMKLDSWLKGAIR
ncbi:Rrf2 family transcriptional regulator [Brevibacillus sp. HB1.2]|uniref:Rrf2 family transcriptional regulator n=1 Tax=Brevibacillus TaxID=55080 RepID=UPI00156A86D2|nr:MULTISPECIES: Rrf2 family transcriptional regulator [unclassified Brevibacillus]NRS15556.1 Rrf2 family transcriptional regulator [Brevibacillus sp. HB1.4B]NTU18785.1 Rrf2 family transcriptional regulator [Brevibacillus sp. HB1.2]NTU29597.1 Rrf2 family transcriptional regulator [Brevibacillus sp. HB1.1]